MKRKNAIPLIKKYITSHEWRVYFNPQYGTYNFELSVMEAFSEEFPDMLEEMGMLAASIRKLINKTHIQFINASTLPNADMPQAEIFLGDDKIHILITYLDGQWYCASSDLFPF